MVGSESYFFFATDCMCSTNSFFPISLRKPTFSQRCSTRAPDCQVGEQLVAIKDFHATLEGQQAVLYGPRQRGDLEGVAVLFKRLSRYRPELVPTGESPWGKGDGDTRDVGDGAILAMDWPDA
jgi:hypothetical protein